MIPFFHEKTAHHIANPTLFEGASEPTQRWIFFQHWAWSLDLERAKDSPSHQDVHDVGRPEVSEVPSAPSILPLQVAKTMQGNRQKLPPATINLFRSGSV